MSGWEDLAARQRGVLSHAQAERAGLSRFAISRKVAAGAWDVVFPGVYRVAGAPDAWPQRLMAATLWGQPAAVSHQAAAALLGLEGFPRGGIEISTLANRTRIPALIVCHRVGSLPPAHLVTRLGIPVTSADRLLLDLAPVLPEPRLDRALDEVLRLGLASRLRIAWTAGHSRAPGRCKLQRLLDQRMAGYAPPDSELEALFFRLLVEWGLPLPVRHYVIRVPGFTGEVDYAWPDPGVGLELDGFLWHNSKHSWQRDRTKRNILTLGGWSVLQFTWDDVVERPEYVRESLYLLLRNPQRKIQGPDLRGSGGASG